MSYFGCEAPWWSALTLQVNSPRSVYAKLLTGDGVYPRLHPLLADTSTAKHLEVGHDFPSASLLFPKSNKLEGMPEAVMVVEAVVDLASKGGVTLANNLIDVMDEMPASIKDGEEDVPVSIAYRIVPSTQKTETAVCGYFLNAGLIGAAGMKQLLSLDNVANLSMEELSESLPSLSAEIKEMISSSSSSACTKTSETDLPFSNFLLANGRVYAPEPPTVAKDDVDLLIQIELPRSRAVTDLIGSDLSFEDKEYFDAISQTSVLLAMEHNKPRQSKLTRSDMVSEIIEFESEAKIEANPLRFSWNEDSDDKAGLQVREPTR